MPSASSLECDLFVVIRLLKFPSGLSTCEETINNKQTVQILTKFELETKVYYIGTDNGANIIGAFIGAGLVSWLH